MRIIIPVILLVTGVATLFVPISSANAGTVSIFCWNANYGPLPAPVPTVGCTAETLPSAGGGQTAFMEVTYACTPNCFVSTPVVQTGPFDANVRRTWLDQIEANCTGSVKTGIAGGRGFTIKHTQSDVIVTVWSTDAITGNVGVYCPAIPAATSFKP